MPTAGEGLHCGSPLGYEGSSVLVIITCVLGLLWAIYNFLALRNIDLEQQADSEDEALMEDMPENEKRVLI